MKKYKLTRKGKNFFSGIMIVLFVLVGCFTYRISMVAINAGTQNVAQAATTGFAAKSILPIQTAKNKTPKETSIAKTTILPQIATALLSVKPVYMTVENIAGAPQITKITAEPKPIDVTNTPKPITTGEQHNHKKKIKNNQSVTTEERASADDNGKIEYNLKDFISYLPAVTPTAVTVEQKNTKGHVEIFYSPHPDDELLSMGAAIAESIQKGNEVHVVLLSHGYETNAIQSLNGDVRCQWHNRTHNPAKEGYQRLTVKEIGALRVVEFKNCVKALGVQSRNIHILNFNADSVSSDEIKLIMLGMEKQFPGAMHGTSSYKDIHPFHKKAGVSLLQLFKSGEVSKARFFISPVQWRQLEGIVISDNSLNERVKAATSMYMQWNPGKREFGIGFHSYQKPFLSLEAEVSSKYHDPDQ